MQAETIETLSLELQNKLDALLQNECSRKFNGIIMIACKTQPVFIRTKGYSDLVNKNNISIDDKFRIQSNTKQITASLVLKEVAEGKIKLDSYLKDYLPNFKQKWADSVTIHHLLNMTSGIKNIEEPLLFQPGEQYYYSDPGYGLLGDVLASVTQKSYSDLANELFMSLGMNNTYCFDYYSENDLPQCYIDDDGAFLPLSKNDYTYSEENWESTIPAFGVISTAKDSVLWNYLLHNGGVISESVYEKMIDFCISARHDAFGYIESGYGYGLRIDYDSPIKHIGHSGKGNGFVSINFYLPQTKMSVIVMENVYNKERSLVYHFEREVLKLMLNSELLL